MSRSSESLAIPAGEQKSAGKSHSGGHGGGGTQRRTRAQHLLHPGTEACDLVPGGLDHRVADGGRVLDVLRGVAATLVNGLMSAYMPMPGGTCFGSMPAS